MLDGKNWHGVTESQFLHEKERQRAQRTATREFTLLRELRHEHILSPDGLQEGTGTGPDLPFLPQGRAAGCEALLNPKPPVQCLRQAAQRYRQKTNL